MGEDRGTLTRREAMALGASLAVGSAVGCAERPSRSSSPPESAPSQAPADLVVLGGTILTGDPERPRAAALAARAGTIVMVGSRQAVEPLRTTQTEVVDLGGGLATAGLTDAHAHVAGLGRSLEQVDLRGAASIDEVVRRLRERGGPGESWIEGRGWDQNLWPGQAMPTHHPLTVAFPQRPVWLRRIDGHAGWGNQALLHAAGITRNTAAPRGGEILRDEAGEPTGVLVDAAMSLVAAPPARRADVARWVLRAQAHLAARGLTGVHDMGVSHDLDAIYRELAQSTDARARLALRIIGYADEDWFLRGLASRQPDVPAPSATYALVGVKLYADGALGSRGAALLDPYADRPGHAGLLQRTQPELDAACARVLGAGWQPATHAIGDAANRAVLDAYARAIQKHRPRDHRARIEHCQIVSLPDIDRFAELGVIASMQPTHATSDMPWVQARIGRARLERAYAWRRFLDAGVPLCFGSDAPVEQVDVTHGLYAAVTRQDPGGKPTGGWLADQRLSLNEALHAFSAAAAHAARRETQLGRLSAGYQADLTCFGRDILSLEPEALRTAPIAATVVAGRVVYRS